MAETRLERLSGDAQKAIDAHDLARRALMAAHDELDLAILDLEAEQRKRASTKLEAITRICAQTNPASSKPFSASQAEDLAQLDPAYAEHKDRLAVYEQARRIGEKRIEGKRTEVDIARERAELAIALVRTEIASGR